MLETLGGYQHINETFSQPNRKLELKFRPETPGKNREAFDFGLFQQNNLINALI